MRGLMRCFGCGIEKNPDEKELYTIDDRLVQDEPIAPLFVLCCQGRGEHDGWRHVVVCHACFTRLDVDHWISSDCWKSISPRVPFDALPLHTEEDCGCDDPRRFEGVMVT